MRFCLEKKRNEERFQIFHPEVVDWSRLIIYNLYDNPGALLKGGDAGPEASGGRAHVGEGEEGVMANRSARGVLRVRQRQHLKRVGPRAKVGTVGRRWLHGHDAGRAAWFKTWEIELDERRGLQPTVRAVRWVVSCAVWAMRGEMKVGGEQCPGGKKDDKEKLRAASDEIRRSNGLRVRKIKVSA